MRFFLIPLWCMLAFSLPGIGEMESVGRVASPDESKGIEVLLDESGRPHYRVTVGGEALLKPSPLGYELKEQAPLTAGFEVVSIGRTDVDETWIPVWGEDAEVRNHCREMTVRLREQELPRRRMDIVLRAYDDGVAFRTIVPRQPGITNLLITSERTAFRFHTDARCWWIRGSYDSYEHRYDTTPLSEVETAATPITLRVRDDLYVSLHEAALTDYAGMKLRRADGDPYTLQAELVPWPDGIKVKRATPMASPWRTLQIGRTPGDLVESHLIVNLNEPNVLADTSWIEPMKYMGIWWSLHIGEETWHAGPKHGATTKNAKRTIDFCAKHGIRGLLIEGWNLGWEKWLNNPTFSFTEAYPDFDLDEVAAYARDRGVMLMGHHETGGNIPSYEDQMEEAFALYDRLGVRAVKTGYAGGIVPEGYHHHGQWMVKHYRRVLETAARHRIMINAHEPIKPTGIRRTYPNMMTREGVRGMEYNAWSEGNLPEHTVILPYTRMLAGPLDFTPGIFELTLETKPDHRVRSTLANQLALYVVLYSPLQMVADLPRHYSGHPAFSFIQAVPVDWDESRVLAGEIGDSIVMARRKGQEWFLGALTDEQARTLEVSLDFLEADRLYRARRYADGPGADWKRNPGRYQITEDWVRRGDSLTLRLAPGGGQAIRFMVR